MGENANSVDEPVPGIADSPAPARNDDFLTKPADIKALSPITQRIWAAERARATTPAMQAMVEIIEQLRVAGKMVPVGIRYHDNGQLGLMWMCADEAAPRQADAVCSHLEAQPADAGQGEKEWPDDRRDNS